MVAFVFLLLSPALSRRALACGGLAGCAAAGLPAARAHALDVREYTALAPLGAADARVGGSKKTGLSLNALAAALAHDVVEGAHGRGGYFVSADIAPELFADDCLFIDPTNSVASLARYTKALTLLFEPSLSTVALLEGPVVNEAARTIGVRVRSGGVLRFPWRPRIAPYESEILWRVGADGLVSAQEQTWSVSPAEALRQTFTPDFRAMAAAGR